jgi:hypothetical protein
MCLGNGWTQFITHYSTRHRHRTPFFLRLHSIVVRADTIAQYATTTTTIEPIQDKSIKNNLLYQEKELLVEWRKASIQQLYSPSLEHLLYTTRIEYVGRRVSEWECIKALLLLLLLLINSTTNQQPEQLDFLSS